MLPSHPSSIEPSIHSFFHIIIHPVLPSLVHSSTNSRSPSIPYLPYYRIVFNFPSIPSPIYPSNSLLIRLHSYLHQTISSSLHLSFTSISTVFFTSTKPSAHLSTQPTTHLFLHTSNNPSIHLSNPSLIFPILLPVLSSISSTINRPPILTFRTQLLRI